MDGLGLFGCDGRTILDGDLAKSDARLGCLSEGRVPCMETLGIGAGAGSNPLFNTGLPPMWSHGLGRGPGLLLFDG